MQNPFWSYDPDYWYAQLHASPSGFTEAQVTELMKASGGHRRQKTRLEKDLSLFFGQFKNPLMLLLIAAVILSAFLGETSDVYIISFIVLSTGTLSFFQERNAGRVVEKLQSLISLKSTALRNGKETEVLSSSIVPGDVMVLKAGDIIVADCLVLESNELHANEAGLTGESYPVRKFQGKTDALTPLAKRSNCLWEGSSIISGSGKALVIQTGEHTIFGSITQSASTITETAFEKGISHFGFFLMKITLVLSLFILAVNLLLHRPVIDSVLFALALAVGMAPELLPAINTIAMSAGAKRMLQKKVIVKKLSSIQNLGEVNLLCTDKTGTITEGVIEISGVCDKDGNGNEFVKKLAFINASMESGYANPIDDALKKLIVPAAAGFKKTGEVPYDFVRKRISIGASNGTENILISKGSVTELLKICHAVMINETKSEPLADHLSSIQNKWMDYGKAGFRTIGVCYKKINSGSVSTDDEKEMTFAGFVVLQDPVKPGIIDVISKLNNLDVGIRIITGDNKSVAGNIAAAIGMIQPVLLTGQEMDAMSPEAFVVKANNTQIFAEVEPHQKERIIHALQKNYTVAYMGDGINDVAAIKAADVGISVNNAADVAREAADFVLLEKNLAVIADGIVEGRKTFANTLKYIFINTGATFGNMFSVAIASLLLPFLPMLPKQILLTNFLTDFPYLSVASDNVDEERLRQPGKWNMKLIRNYMIFFGIHSSLFDLITFMVLLHVLGATESVFQTGWFVESVLTELMILFIIRTARSFLKSKPGRNLFLLSLLGLIVTVMLPYLPFASSFGLVPLTMPVITALMAIVILYVITADLLKIWFFRKYRNTN